jgi:hypothetical protein
VVVIFFAYKVLIVHTLLFNEFSAGVSPLLIYKKNANSGCGFNQAGPYG